ncbi:Gti1/Pac2 family-domain-containing protein [Pilobolus umbonatus]|nr:Gti1/Pac2 family-domain-containing protein [Pilobolus umbonatus]
MPINETFHGFVENTTDTLLIFEACRRGILPRISRRLQERERGAVKSGTIFVFDEKESGIKRWTDGLIWSPSRILGNFLVYRELDGRESINNKSDYRYNPPYHEKKRPVTADEVENMSIEDRNKERALVGSLTDTYKFKKGGLIKKTLSINLNGSAQHLISYYTKEDVFNCRLVTPSSIPEIASLQIIPELFSRQSFRIPPSLEYSNSVRRRPSLSPSSTTSSVSSHSKKKYSYYPYFSHQENMTQCHSRYPTSDILDSARMAIQKKPNNQHQNILPLSNVYRIPTLNDGVYSKYNDTGPLW